MYSAKRARLWVAVLVISRLSGDGRIFDYCPKILTLPRSDCAIAFAGYTGHAFPMMLQLSLAIDAHTPARSRSIEVAAIRKHALKVFDSLAGSIRSSDKVSISQDVDPEADFLFGGYSWVKKEFQLWSISFSKSEERFVARPALWAYYSQGAKRVLLSKARKRENAIGRIVFAGDQARKASQLVCERLTASHQTSNGLVGIGKEPFEVVRDMLRDENHSETIGGAPQLVKVYQYMQTTPFAVYWPDKSTGKVYLQGRPCLGYERIERWVIDPDTLRSESAGCSRGHDEAPLDMS